jgi:hypothetical protein
LKEGVIAYLKRLEYSRAKGLRKSRKSIKVPYPKPQIEPQAFKIQSRSTNHSTTMFGEGYIKWEFDKDNVRGQTRFSWLRKVDKTCGNLQQLVILGTATFSHVLRGESQVTDPRLHMK